MNKYTNTKKERIDAIKKILKEKKVKSQQEMVKLLKKVGLDVSQPTIARDFEELGVVKARSGAGSFYKLPGREEEVTKKRLKAAFENFVIEIKAVQNLVLVKTVPGNAGGVASIIDHIKLNGIEGTIAGDDTILVVTRPGKTSSVLKFFKKLT